jgi:PKD repeat protein
MGDATMQTRSGRQVSYQYADTGTFKVFLTTTDISTTCTSEDSVDVTVLYVPGYLQLPDALCPGCNDYRVRQLLPIGKGLSFYHLQVFDLWGKLLFETSALNPDGSPRDAWNVQYKDGAIEENTYRWVIEARFVNGTEWQGMKYPNHDQPVKTGFLTIIK